MKTMFWMVAAAPDFATEKAVQWITGGAGIAVVALLAWLGILALFLPWMVWAVMNDARKSRKLLEKMQYDMQQLRAITAARR